MHSIQCGMPMMEYVCNECGAKIGGTDHKALPDQKLARQLSSIIVYNNYKFKSGTLISNLKTGCIK